MLRSNKWILPVVLLAATAMAQQPEGRGAGRGGSPGFRNLQVLPKDMPAPQVIQIMLGFEAALGVTCEHCHVDFGRGNSATDLASDAKQPKKTARIMMMALSEFNSKLTPADLGKDNVAQARCGTCHRGKPIPDYVPPPPPAEQGGRGKQ